MVSKPWLRCPLSGETDPHNLLRIKLIPELDDNADELKLPCTEWFWGLKRGGLQYHLANAHNSLFFRRDIAHLYASFQFILAPTFKTFLDIVDFNQRAGILCRADDDISPRRPLTALTPPSGFYRYVFIPMTDAARQLQKELNLPPQTEEDLNGGLDPRSKRPLHEGTETFTVVECFAHPYCVSTLAEHAFNYYDDWATRVTAQWSLCTLNITRQWSVSKERDVPRWFIDMPGMDEDDITVTSAEGAGYTISRRSQDGNGRPRTVYEGQEALQAKVSAWAEQVDRNSQPEEQPPILREPIPVRRSVRIAERAKPYQRPKQAYYHRPESPVRKAPWPCPEDEDPYESPPAWATRNGQYPTRGFSSNDWAYFCYSISLPAPRKP
ncbi:uncharacterized protein SCHCODRAFT_02559520 [Schizophyllum commune H4-8]|nr:uncharacterized protein SCHCODRAFT_02559520 [Schizophyllum commune H4-8]KAI5900702.1 hypothetical protein SCHCODRAFT_02559520 [Schizophyllum commune H4-8]